MFSKTTYEIEIEGTALSRLGTMPRYNPLSPSLRTCPSERHENALSAHSACAQRTVSTRQSMSPSYWATNPGIPLACGEGEEAPW